MAWLFCRRTLQSLGILGMNRRNATCILDHNPRRLIPVVDDKLRMHRLCAWIGVPSPTIFAVIERHSQLRNWEHEWEGPYDCVVKPNRGSAGRGVLVFTGGDGQTMDRHNGERWCRADLRQHISDALSGMYSLGGRPDAVLFQQRVQPHLALIDVAFQGVPDIRVIVYRGEPVMAMLRLPTHESNGRANLHQGGIGVGIDMDTGQTCHAVQRNRVVGCHPDTGAALIGRRIPEWAAVLDISRRVAGAVGLGYLGVDVVLDADCGPLLLEANARPGLAIQIANQAGLIPRLDAIDRRLVAARTNRQAPYLAVRRHDFAEFPA